MVIIQNEADTSITAVSGSASMKQAQSSYFFDVRKNLLRTLTDRNLDGAQNVVTLEEPLSDRL